MLRTLVGKMHLSTLDLDLIILKPYHLYDIPRSFPIPSLCFDMTGKIIQHVMFNDTIIEELKTSLQEPIMTETGTFGKCCLKNVPLSARETHTVWFLNTVDKKP